MAELHMRFIHTDLAKYWFGLSLHSEATVVLSRHVTIN